MSMKSGAQDYFKELESEEGRSKYFIVDLSIEMGAIRHLLVGMNKRLAIIENQLKK